MSKLKTRLQPLLEKLAGRAPLCPLGCVAAPLHPNTLRIHPPALAITEVDSSGRLKLLEFGGRHRFWFPAGMTVSAELWSEYLVADQFHPSNLTQHFRRDGIFKLKQGS